MVLVNHSLKLTKAVHTTLVRVENSYEAFAGLLELYQQQTKQTLSGIDNHVFIHQTVTLGNHVYVGAFSYIGQHVKIGHRVKIHPQCYIGNNVTIDDDTEIYPGVKIYHQSAIGKSCTLHSGVVIGADGFGFAPQNQTEFRKIPQIGNVVIEDHVEIGTNTTIDRATMGSTIIRKGVKLDNLVQVGHNVEIGENTVIAAQSGISGSTKIGKNCMVGGQVGFAGHITIADGTKIAAQTGIANNIKKQNQMLMGYPGFDLRSFQKSTIVFRNLPQLSNDLTILKQEMEQLKKKLDEK